MKISNENLVECFDLVFSKVHSKGFKIAEISNLLYSDDYQFLEVPRENWKTNLRLFLYTINVDYEFSKTLS